MSSNFPAFAELIAKTEHCALHLQMRDVHTPQGHGDFAALVRDAVGRGVDWRRARIVAEPGGAVVRDAWETTTRVNVAAGEKVRWLPRQRAADLLLPGNDFWVFDDRLLRWTHLERDGSWGRHEFSRDPELIRRCRQAFEAVWERAVDHAEFTPRRTAPSAA